MKLKRQNEDLSLLSSEGNYLIIREHFNNNKSPYNQYYLEALPNGTPLNICISLNINKLISFFKNEIKLKELFYTDNNESLYKYNTGTGNDNVTEFQLADDPTIIENLNCGENYYKDCERKELLMTDITNNTHVNPDSLIILEAEGPYLSIENYNFNPSSPYSKKHYYIQCLLNNKGHICSPLNIINLLSFYKGDLSIKELFAHSYNQPYYYSENQYFETYQKLEYTQAIDYLNNIHCGENNFLQSEKKHLIIRKFNAQ